jgi:hypothetical protein
MKMFSFRHRRHKIVLIIEIVNFFSNIVSEILGACSRLAGASAFLMTKGVT